MYVEVTINAFNLSKKWCFTACGDVFEWYSCLTLDISMCGYGADRLVSTESCLLRDGRCYYANIKWPSRKSTNTCRFTNRRFAFRPR